MDRGTSRMIDVVARRGRWAGIVAALTVTATIVACRPVPPDWDRGALAACAGDQGDPASGAPEWQQADQDNRRCATEGLRMLQANPAVGAARQANTAAGQLVFQGDPFRAPHRWKGRRGSYELTTYTDRNGATWSAALFGPLDAGAGPHPGVVLACHACPLFPTTEGVSQWYFAAEALAEAGYVVMYASIAGNSAPTTVDATDWFVATPEAPTARGGFNPWHARVDRTRLGIVGHSGAGVVVLDVGHTDARFDAVVAWDPAPIPAMQGVTPRVPTMIQTAEYEFSAPARPEKPTPAAGSKYTFFDRIGAAGIDVMQVAPRASMHVDWGRFSAGLPHGIYGETVGLYYTLAWFDRYLAPSRSDGPATDALRRLTASGTDPFDNSADIHSIGAGYFDADKASQTGTTEGGNVPITIEGRPVRNLLSLQYDSRYSLDGGSLRCADLRAGCPR